MDFSKTLSKIPNNFEVIVFPELNHTITGAELLRCSAVFAAWLQERGLKTIGIHMPNCPEFVYLFTGALRAGVRTVVYNALSRTESDIPTFDKKDAAIILDSRLSAPADFTAYDWRLDETIMYMSTSGTNGKRKMIGKSLKGFFGEKGVRPIWRLASKGIRVRIYNCSPWYHVIGMVVLMMGISALRITQITAEKYNPDTMRQNINKTRPNTVTTTPTMLARCAESGEMTLPRYCFCAGEGLSAETIALLEKRGGAQLLINMYGTTEAEGIADFFYLFKEAGPFIRTVLPIVRVLMQGGAVFNSRTLKPGCLGALLKGVEVRIMSGGEQLGEGETGEIFVRTSTMHERAENDFYNTGDMGYIKDGLLFYAGRSGSVINRSGEKILPEDIERVLRSLPGVNAAAVFSVPSKTHGEDICAAVESENAAPVVTVEALKDRLPKYMLPQRLLFFEKLPMTESGKTNLSVLRDYAMK